MSEGNIRLIIYIIYFIVSVIFEVNIVINSWLEFFFNCGVVNIIY